MLEETGIDYGVEIIGYGAPMQGEAFRAINPMAKVPALVHAGRVITEGAAICAYLADAFPDAGLAPALDDRADYYRWLFFAAGPLEHAITNRSLGFEAPADKSPMLGYGDFDRTMDTLADTVADCNRREAYIAGARFSAADVYVASHIGFGLMFKTIDPRPEFLTYWQRFEARPARLRAAELDDAAAAAAV